VKGPKFKNSVPLKLIILERDPPPSRYDVVELPRSSVTVKNARWMTSEFATCGMVSIHASTRFRSAKAEHTPVIKAVFPAWRLIVRGSVVIVLGVLT